jgi:hypothetical protein
MDQPLEAQRNRREERNNSAQRRNRLEILDLTYREDDERELLLRFARWMAGREGSHRSIYILAFLVDEFLKERAEAREWGK